MANTQGLENVILPSFFGAPGDALEKNISRNQQESQFSRDLQERSAERQYARQQQNRLYNLSQINKETDADQYKTGQDRLDDYVMGELTRLKNNAISNYVNLDPAEMEYRLNQDMGNLVRWDAATKTGYKNLEKTLADFSTQYPNTDSQKAKQILENQFLRDVGNVDEQGNFMRKNPNQIQFSDYGATLMNPKVGAELLTGLSPITDYLSKSATQDVSPKYKNERLGVTKVENYKGKINPVLQEVSGLPDKEGYLQGTPQVNFKTEKHGNLEMMPTEIFNETFMDTPQKRYTFNAAWQKQKDFIERSSTAASGQLMQIPDGSPQDDYLKRSFAMQIAKRHVPAMLNPDFQTTQAPVLTRIELGYPPQNSPANAAVNDLYGSVYTKASNDADNGHYTRFNSLSGDEQNIIMGYVKDNPNYAGGEIVLQKQPNGSIEIHNTVDKGKHANKNPDGGYTLNSKSLITILPKVGTNLKVQPNTASKVKVVEQGNNQPKSTQSKTYHYNGKTYTQSQIEKGAEHYNISVDEYLKQLGIQ